MLLRNADTRVMLDAAHGGAIREFNWRGAAILRTGASEADTDPMATSCFPLVPYANRVANGHFAFNGRAVQLRRNWDKDPHPLHGQGWRSAWEVEQSSAAVARLSFIGGGDDWPWRYRAVQDFEVHADGLEIRLAVENLSDGAMPAMLGLHPYFPQAALATVEARTRTVWLTDAQALPVQEVMTPPEWSFDRVRPASRVSLDHCFDHWDGLAVLRWPDRVLQVRATGCNSLHIYTPAGTDFFCIEPQTVAAGALGRASGGAAVLPPGDQLEMKVRFSVGQA
jgi:aldose 1-epimerase